MLLFTAQIIAILSVFLLAVGYLKTDPRAPSAWVFGFIALFVSMYLIGGMGGESVVAPFRLALGGWQPVISVASNSISGLFMIYCFLIFQEAKRLPTALVLAFGGQVFLETVLRLGADQFDYADVVSLVLDLLQLSFVGLAIYWTFAGWRADLVEDRRVFRWFVITVQGALIFLVLFLENFLLVGGTQAYAGVHAVTVYSIAVLAFGMLLISMKFDYVSLSQAIRKVTEREPDPAELSKTPFDIDSFNVAFRDAKLYREAGLTIAMLASKLVMPEYRLRAFIHQELGFRNFNAMLHVYRVEEACTLLAAGDKVSLPVLTIALSVGYQSITPFNNAFKELQGVTPSEYRKQRQT